MDIPGFLRTHAPFDDLSDDELAEVVRATHIEFFPRSQRILAQGGEPARHLYVVRTGSVEVLDDDHVVDLHQEGEVFGYVSLLTREEPALSVRAHEETICYLVDREVAERILATRRGVSFLSRSVRRRELELLQTAVAASAADPWSVPVRTLIRRAPITAGGATSVREAAELMTRERVSSLLVRAGDTWAIVTDRDLRTRVLAEGRSPGAAVRDVSSSPLVTLTDDATVGDVLAVMLERRIHHVPVTDGLGEIVGVVTDTDLMTMERRSAFQLRRDIEGSANEHAAIDAARSAPSMIADLVEASVEPLEIAHVAAVTNDTVTSRLLELGIDRLGEPPCPWAWLALGSEARHEQGVATDQDNALAYEPEGLDPHEVDEYFAKLATIVNDGLAMAGIPRCRAGVIASNREWRGTVSEWEQRFRGWVADPGRIGSAFSGIAFDYRPVVGALELRSALDPVIRWAGEQTAYMRHLAGGAVDRPPRGFLKDAVVEARGTSAVTLDIKRAGITPITNLARVYALRAGIAENRTIRRLRAVGGTGRLPSETAEALEEAFRLLWQLRLEHHASRVREGMLADDEVDPRELGPLTRQGLKEAFRVIDRAQGVLAIELGLRR